jgi:hypothetical protein
MSAELTTVETRLVERYVSVLDFVSRCAQGVDEGNTHYLWDKAGQLMDAVKSLRDELATSDGMPNVRPYAVLAAVQQQGRFYRAGRLLHPVRTRLSSTEVRSLLLSVVGASGLEADATVIEAIARDAHAIAATTHVHVVEVARVLCALGCWEVRDAD